jgi:hypothetical protein
MLFDRLSSIESDKATAPKFVRYPKLMKVTVKVTDMGTPPSIFVPLVTIEYGTIDVASLVSRTRVCKHNRALHLNFDHVRPCAVFWQRRASTAASGATATRLA